MVTQSDYSPDACFRSWKIQDAIKGFKPDDIREVRLASRKSYAETINKINQIKNRKEVIQKSC